jgi:RNA polymerase sigma-70 factor (ECF subfamily)
MGEFDHSTRIQALLDQRKAGQAGADDALLQYSFERLQRLAQRMFHRYPDLRSILETGDVVQNAALRLHRALQAVSPDTVRAYFGLAATQIRRELLDLVRQHLGPDHAKAKRFVLLSSSSAESGPPALEVAADLSSEPASLMEWSEFHDQVGRLPDEEREVFGLLWYDGLTQAEAATVLGVDVRTVKRRWRSARRAICEAMQGEPPQI